MFNDLNVSYAHRYKFNDPWIAIMEYILWWYENKKNLHVCK